MAEVIKLQIEDGAIIDIRDETLHSKFDADGKILPESVPTGSKKQLGLLQVGENLTVDEHGVVSADAKPYLLPKASTEDLGGIRVGRGLSIDASGALSTDPYELPRASEVVLGGVKIGKNLTMDDQGYLSTVIDPYTLPVASETTLGGIKAGGELKVNSDGTVKLHLEHATESHLGPVKVGQGLKIDENGILSAQQLDIPVAGTTKIGAVRSGGDIDVDSSTGAVTVKHAANANKLTNARKIELVGDVEGNVYFDGQENVNINTTVRMSSEFASGLMSAADKAKLNKVDEKAKELKVATRTELGGIKSGDNVTVDEDGTLVVKKFEHLHHWSDINNIDDRIQYFTNEKADKEHNHVRADHSNDGFMSYEDKVKLDNIEPQYFEPATKEKLGPVIVGDNIEVDSTGKISTHAPYVLPKASAYEEGQPLPELGGIIVGEGLEVDSDGVLSTGVAVIPLASETRIGGLESGGEYFEVDQATNKAIVKKADNATHAENADKATQLNDFIRIELIKDIKKGSIKFLGNEEDPIIVDVDIDEVSDSKHGFMSVADKLKLDTVENGANKYVLPQATDEVLGGIKSGKPASATEGGVTVDSDGHVIINDYGHKHNPNEINELQDFMDNVHSQLTNLNNNKLDSILKGAPDGLAELGSDGKVPSSQLPSFVDNIVEGYYNKEDGKFYKEPTYETEIPGEDNKIYISLDTNVTYRWSGTVFVEISASLALGETSSTAYRGDRGKIAYDHSQLADGTNPHATTFANIVDNIATTTRLGGIIVGENLNIEQDGTLNAVDTTYPEASESAAGLMSVADKTKLDGIDEGANKYELPAATADALGGIKVGANLNIDTDGLLNAVDTTYGLATSDTSGLMFYNDKAKLDTVEENANAYVLPQASDSVLGGVKVGENLNINVAGVLSAVDTTYEDATDVKSGLMSINDKIKLDGIDEGANKYELPAATADALGGIKVGARLTITDGVLSADNQTFILPKATIDSLGGVKLSTSIVADGTDGSIKVADNSHAHLISNITDLQQTLDNKLEVSQKGASNGVAKLDGNKKLDVENFVPATATTLGMVKQGNNVTIAADGTISASDSYILPKATTSELGGVKVGANLSIDEDGVLSTHDQYVLPTATDTVLGGIKASGSINISTNGIATVANDSHTHAIANVTGLETVLSNKLDTSLKGTAGGLAELGANGKVPTDQLPIFVESIEEGYFNANDNKFYEDAQFTRPIAGQTGKIYFGLNTGLLYRWTGASSDIFVNISSLLTLGETESTAYRGDRGKAAYDHSQLADGTNPHKTTFANIIDNIATVEKLGGIIVGDNLNIDASGKLDAVDTTYSEATTDASGLMSIADKTKLDSVQTGANKYELPVATADTLGGVKQGANVTIAADGTISVDSPYTLPEATADTLGGIKVGSRLSILDGVLSADDQSYTLTKATADELGGIKVGARLTIDQDGVLTADDQSYVLPAATSTELGGIKVGSRLSILNGVLSADDQTYTLPIASGSVLGGVKASTSINVSANGVATVANDSHTHTIANVTGLETALLNKLETSLKGTAGGLAELDINGRVPASQLPTYVHGIIEGYFNDVDSKFYKDAEFSPDQKIDGEDGKIYFGLNTGLLYRWTGPTSDTFVNISSSLTLGETRSTAYYGDLGKIAYTHSQLADGTNPHATTFANIVDNIATTTRLGGIIVGDNLNIDATGKLDAVDTTYENATTSAAGLMSTSDKVKLDGVEVGANNYSLPVATDTVLGGVKQGNNITIDTDGTISTSGPYELPAATATKLGGIKVGTNLSIDVDGVLSATDTTYENATSSVAGLMSATDKTKLDGIDEGANKYELPEATADTLGGIKVGARLTITDGVLSADEQTVELPVASDTVLGGIKVGTNLSIDVDGVLSATDTTYENATTSAAGLMSATDKTKLDGIDEGANNYELPAATADALGGIKVGTNLSIDLDGVLSATDTTYEIATSSVAGLMSAADKAKLDNIETSSETSVIEFTKPIKVTEIQLPSGIIIS